MAFRLKYPLQPLAGKRMNTYNKAQERGFPSEGESSCKWHFLHSGLKMHSSLSEFTSLFICFRLWIAGLQFRQLFG